MGLTQELFNKYKIVINGYTFSPDEFTNFQNVNVRTYSSTPERALDFSMPDIRDILTGKVAKLKISFEFMPIEVYQRLCKAIDTNEFSVTYFDYETGVVVDRLMYATPQDYETIFNTPYNKLVILGKTIEFIATMNEQVEHQVAFDYNGGTATNGDTSHNIVVPYLGTLQISGGKGITKSGFSTINKWNTMSDGSGTDFAIGSTYTPNTSFVLYAVWG